jgi:HEAT repeat protein
MRYTGWTVVVAMAGAVGVGWAIARGGESDEATHADSLSDLGSADSKTREAAIDSLAKASGTTFAALQTALEDEPSALVKAGIADAIVRKGPKAEDVASLATSLLSSDPTTRVEAARAIGRTHPDAAREALEMVATNRSELAEVRSVAAVALGAAGSDAEKALAELAAAQDVPVSLRCAALRGLALSGADGVKAVVAVADDAKADRSVRDAAVAALGSPDAKSEDALIDLLASKAEGTRALALRAIDARGSGTDAIRSALVDQFSDASPALRGAAAGVLVTLGGASGSKTELLGLLDDADESVRLSAIDALGRGFASGDTKVADALAKQIDDKSFAIRYHAALALGEMKDARGLDAMKNHQSSESTEEKAAADDAAARIDEQTKK